jgi:hypothetical protein
MIDKKYSRIIIALALAMSIACVATDIWGPAAALKYRLGIFIPIAGILLSWLSMRFWVWLSVDPRESLSDAMRRFFGRALVAFTAILCAAGLYVIAGIWHRAPAFSPQIFLQLSAFALGLIVMLFGNVAPKLPYQKTRHWFEMGPARYHRLNRIGGWMTVAAGIAILTVALIGPMEPNFIRRAFLAITIAFLLPIGTLSMIYVRSYRREIRAATSN